MKTLKSVLIIFLLFSSTSFLLSQVIGKDFPKMDTETVEDKPIVIPNDTKDKFTLVGLAYSKKSEADLNTWFNPVYNRFIKEDGGGLFAGFGYDVNVYFVPMFTGAKATAEGTAKKKAAKDIDPLLLPHILFYKGKLKPYKEALEFDKKDVPYFFVINKEGKIVYATTGKFTEGKMEEVEEVLED